jgi:hypothetical protein
METVGERSHGPGDLWTFQNWWPDEREGDKFKLKTVDSSSFIYFIVLIIKLE